MPQFLLSVWHDEPVDFDPSVPPDPAMQRMFDRVGEFHRDLETAGAWVMAGGLEPPSAATVVRSTGDAVTATTGPYSSVPEHMGGFWVIDVADLDTAVEWATRGSAACEQPVEVRPFHAD